MSTLSPLTVRRELKQKFEALPIFKRDRATALHHFLVALESTKRIAALP